MRLVTYLDPARGSRAAALVGQAPHEGLIDLADHSGGKLPADLVALLALGPDALSRAADVAARSGPDVGLAEAQLEAPIPRPPKILAAAANYQAHIIEAGLPPVDRTRIVPDGIPRWTEVGWGSVLVDGTVGARWRSVATKTGARLRIEPFQRLSHEERADTREEAARLAAFLAPETDVRIEL